MQELFGNLGIEILRQLTKTNAEIIAADIKEKDDPELKGKYQFIPIDVTKPETLKDICQGVDKLELHTRLFICE